MTRRGFECGFSLVEVIVALGLLAAVLLSISGLFLVGDRQVKSGRTHSSALAVARDIVEEMNGWGYVDVYRGFGLSGSASSYTVDTRSNTAAAKWQQALDRDLQGSYALIGLESIADGAAPALDAATAVRVTVTVFWNEGLRARSVQLATVRL